MAPDPDGKRNVPSTRSEAVANELRRLIQSGELGPGTRLRQADIAERFMVSTTPVREAFASLARDGLVRQDAHRGAVVSSPSSDELRETYEIRGVLEALAARLATSNLTADDLGSLEEIAYGMRGAAPEDYVELNRSLHRRIYAAAGRPRLLEIIEQLRELSANHLAATMERLGPAYRVRVQAEHEAIIHALALKDAELVSRLIGDHVRWVPTEVEPARESDGASIRGRSNREGMGGTR
jgi:DNA-binding GntR family transcriptional regulator